MIGYLTINQPIDNLELPYKEQYKVFLNYEEAVEYIKICGFESMMGINKKVGVMSFYAAGDIRISIMPIEIKE